MTVVNWDRFDWSGVLRPDGARVAGATAEAVAFGSRAAFHLITKAEIRQTHDRSRNLWRPGTPEHDTWMPTDASGWEFPHGPFPPSYLSLVRWSNGGAFRAGVDRTLRIVPIDGVRTKMIELHSPENMPLAVPFAWNDYYDIYCFDMREPLRDEYPILVTRGNAMHYAASFYAAAGLLEFLQLPENPRPRRHRSL